MSVGVAVVVPDSDTVAVPEGVTLAVPAGVPVSVPEGVTVPVPVGVTVADPVDGKVPVPVAAHLADYFQKKMHCRHKIKHQFVPAILPAIYQILSEIKYTGSLE